MSSSNEVCRAFLEYIIAEKAREARIPCERLEWQEEDSARIGGERLLTLTLHSAGSSYVEHFPEDDVRRYLADPQAFGSVEARVAYLLGRVLRGARRS